MGPAFRVQKTSVYECVCEIVANRSCVLMLVQGVRAVLAESFERIHRSNLVGMGIIPLQYKTGDSADSLQLTGRETFTVDLPDNLRTQQDVTVYVSRTILK